MNDLYAEFTYIIAEETRFVHSFLPLFCFFSGLFRRLETEPIPSWNGMSKKRYFETFSTVSLVGVVLDQQELDAVWEYCSVEKATSSQKERYSETFEKANKIKKELTDKEK